MHAAIYNPYPPEKQWARMWEDRSLEREIELCDARQLRIHLLEMLEPLDNPVVVEAGCGIGAWVAYLSRHNLKRTIGVDNYAPALSELRRYSPGSLAVAADVGRMPFPDESVDACISLGVVEHFPDGPGPLIAEMFRILRPGGYLFLTTPYYNLFRRLFIHPLRATYLTIYKNLRHHKLYFVEYRFTRSELTTFVRGCGFEILRVATDEYEPADLALGLSVDFPPFRGEFLGKLNALGMFVRQAALRISPWLTTGGILVVARKPSTGHSAATPGNGGRQSL